MRVFTLGSINIDRFYEVPRLPGAGETVLATAHSTDLGGKGANQSVAAARAGADVVHIGRVGPDGQGMVDRLAGFGVDVRFVGQCGQPTAHANICVDPDGENAIIVYPGANLCQDMASVRMALAGAGPGDWLMVQNETDAQTETAALARDRGVSVAYSAAPFDAKAVAAMMPYCDLLIMNAVEAAQLQGALGRVDVPCLLMTRGKDGADWTETRTGTTLSVPAVPVTPIDTTGAGDCFAGFTVAGLVQGLSPRTALTRAAAAAALQVTRRGAAPAMPTLDEVLDLIG